MRRLLLLIFFVPTTLFGQHPGVAFETGNFNAWEKLVGTKYYGVGLQTLVTQTSSNSVYRFAIQDDTAAFDPNTGNQIPTIPEGFSYAIRLGDLSGNLEAERMRFIWTVTAENAILSYRYAIVTEQPNHEPGWLPTVGFLVRDLDSNVLECSEQIVLPGYTNLPLETVGGTFPVVKYNKWRTVAVDLSPYIGETLIFEAANSDCGLGPHTSYVYFAVECFDKSSTEDYCKKSGEVDLTMPEGFSDYLWNTGDTGRHITVQSPVSGDSFTCTVTAYTCTTEFEVVISETDVDAVFRVEFDTTLVAARFFNESTAENSYISAYSWSFGDGFSSSLPNPLHTYDSFGTFNIELTAVNNFGCADSQFTQYINYPPPYPAFSIKDSCGLSCEFLNLTRPPFVGEITGYSWEFGDGFSSNVEHPTHEYAKAGKYLVQLTVEASNIVKDKIVQEIEVYANPKADFHADSACILNPTEFYDRSEILEGEIVSWDWTISNDTTADIPNPVLTFSKPELISVNLSVKSDKGCSDTILKKIEIYPETVMADFGITPRPIEALETKVQFKDSSENAVRWIWSIDSEMFSTEQNPSNEFLRDTGTYWVGLAVSNQFGCEDYIEKKLEVEPIVALYIPNSFSPDGDGINDEFILKGEGVQWIEMKLWDRWGNEVSMIREMNKPITLPTIQNQTSVFSYEAFFTDKNGLRHYRVGTITAVR